MKYMLTLFILSISAFAQLPTGNFRGLEFFGFDDCRQKQYGRVSHSLRLYSVNGKIHGSSSLTGNTDFTFDDVGDAYGYYYSSDREFLVIAKNGKPISFATMRHWPSGPDTTGRVIDINASRPWRVCILRPRWR